MVAECPQSCLALRMRCIKVSSSFEQHHDASCRLHALEVAPVLHRRATVSITRLEISTAAEQRASDVDHYGLSSDWVAEGSEQRQRIALFWVLRLLWLWLASQQLGDR